MHIGRSPGVVMISVGPCCSVVPSLRADFGRRRGGVSSCYRPSAASTTTAAAAATAPCPAVTTAIVVVVAIVVPRSVVVVVMVVMRRRLLILVVDLLSGGMCRRLSSCLHSSLAVSADRKRCHLLGSHHSRALGSCSSSSGCVVNSLL